MNEFGHNAIAGKIADEPVHADSWGAGPFVIEAGGKPYRFEDSDRFGPHLVNRRGDVVANPWPPERSPFWRAHYLWRAQDRQLAADGYTCIWREPKPWVFRSEKRGRQNHLVVLEKGEPNGRELWEDGTPFHKHPNDCSGAPP